MKKYTFKIGDRVKIVGDSRIFKDEFTGQEAVVIWSYEGCVVVNNKQMEEVFGNSLGISFKLRDILPTKEYRFKTLMKQYEEVRNKGGRDL